MAASQLIASGNSVASSSDFTLAAGEIATVSLKGAEDGARADIELKDDGGGYTSVGLMTNAKPAWSISSPGVYRVSRRAGATCGVFRG